MKPEIFDVINQIGLVLGLIATILLAFSTRVGVISRNGNIIFGGLDPMAPPDENEHRVVSSHRRSRLLQPVGWSLFAVSFALQFTATFK